MLAPFIVCYIFYDLFPACLYLNYFTAQEGDITIGEKWGEHSAGLNKTKN